MVNYCERWDEKRHQPHRETEEKKLNVKCIHIQSNNAEYSEKTKKNIYSNQK